jgi:hypothetical protein
MGLSIGGKRRVGGRPLGVKGGDIARHDAGPSGRNIRDNPAVPAEFFRVFHGNQHGLLAFCPQEGPRSGRSVHSSEKGR